MIMRGPLFPWGMLFDDGSIIVTAQAVEESGPAAYVRSTDRGQTWRPFLPPPDINYASFFTSGYGGLLSLAPGRFMAIFDYAAPQPWKDQAAHGVGVVDITVERN
jgi:hypothetical protein